MGNWKYFTPISEVVNLLKTWVFGPILWSKIFGASPTGPRPSPFFRFVSSISCRCSAANCCCRTDNLILKLASWQFFFVGKKNLLMCLEKRVDKKCLRNGKSKMMICQVRKFLNTNHRPQETKTWSEQMRFFYPLKVCGQRRCQKLNSTFQIGLVYGKPSKIGETFEPLNPEKGPTYYKPNLSIPDTVILAFWMFVDITTWYMYIYIYIYI